ARPRRAPIEGTEQRQQRGLSDAGRAAQRHHLPGVDLHGRAAEHAHDLRTRAVLALEVEAGEQGRATRSGGHPPARVTLRGARVRWWPGTTGAASRSRSTRNPTRPANSADT